MNKLIRYNNDKYLVKSYSVSTNANNQISLDIFPRIFKQYDYNNPQYNIDDYVSSIKIQQTGVYGKYSRAIINLLNIQIQSIQRLFPPAMTVSLYNGTLIGFVSNVD